MKINSAGRLSPLRFELALAELFLRGGEGGEGRNYVWVS